MLPLKNNNCGKRLTDNFLFINLNYYIFTSSLLIKTKNMESSHNNVSYIVQLIDSSTSRNNNSMGDNDVSESVLLQSLYHMYADQLKLLLSTIFTMLDFLFNHQDSKTHQFNFKQPNSFSKTNDETVGKMKKYLEKFCLQIENGSVPYIYAIKCAEQMFRFSAKEEGEKISLILKQMASVLQIIGKSKISFSTESEFVAIFKILFSKKQFSNQLFCIVQA